MKLEALRDRIQTSINSTSAENGSNTPDFILAEFLTDCLSAFDKCSRAREKWYGRELRIGMSEQVAPAERPALAYQHGERRTETAERPAGEAKCCPHCKRAECRGSCMAHAYFVESQPPAPVKLRLEAYLERRPGLELGQVRYAIEVARLDLADAQEQDRKRIGELDKALADAIHQACLECEAKHNLTAEVARLKAGVEVEPLTEEECNSIADEWASAPFPEGEYTSNAQKENAGFRQLAEMAAEAQRAKVRPRTELSEEELLEAIEQWHDETPGGESLPQKLEEARRKKASVRGG